MNEDDHGVGQMMRISTRRADSGTRSPVWFAMCGVVFLGSIDLSVAPRDQRCSCLRAPELAVAVSVSDAVFLGTVSGVREWEELPSTAATDGDLIVLPRREVTLQVLSGWKGEPGDSVAVKTGLSDADCGFPFELGATYLVFASQDGAALTTSICSRTAPVADALDDIFELGSPVFGGGPR